jgi:hypothetical protein
MLKSILYHTKKTKTKKLNLKKYKNIYITIIIIG